MKRALLLIFLIYILVLLGLASINGGVLALAIPLIIYLGAALYFGPETLQLTVSRTLSETCVTQGTFVEVTLSVTNESGHAEEFSIQDILPPLLVVEAGEIQTLAALGPGETLTLTYTVKGPRGSFSFQAVEVIVSERLGIYRRRQQLLAPAHLLILPVVERLKPVTIRPLRTRAYAGPIPSRQGGSGIDFFGVREYQPGDPMRWLNWRASARHTRALFTNEFEQERIADVGIILDARQHSNIYSPNVSLFEHAVRATAALSETFLNEGNRVALLIYGRGLERTYPGYGKVQRERILRALAAARTGDSLVFERLDYLPTRFFPPKSQIVIVSSLCEEDLPVLLELRSRGYQILIISPNAVSYETQMLMTRTSTDPDATTPGNIAMAGRVANLERALLLHRMRRVGIQVVDWDVEKSLDSAIQASIRIWSRGAHPMIMAL